MKNAFKRLSLGTIIVVSFLSLTSCGEVPVFRWNFGRPTSFAFTKSGLEPIVRNLSRASVSRNVAEIDYIDYGDLISDRLERDEIQTIREANGTLIESYTPDVFRIPMTKVGFLSSETGGGFWVVLSDEGIFGEIEFIDFIDPVYIRRDGLWDNIHYDLLFSMFELGISDIGGDPFTADIQIVAPGYTDEDMPDYYLGTKGHHRKYLGSNRFAVSAGELFLTAWEGRGFQSFLIPPSMLLFRETITKPAIYSQNEALYFEDMNVLNDRLRPLLYSDNAWELDQPFGPGCSGGWVDLPYDGLHVGEDADELIITVSWDLENIIELWDFGSDGLHFQLAADFVDRFAVEVQQISE